MLDIHITQTEVANFPCTLEISHCPKRLGKGDIGIIEVAEMNKVKMIQPEPLQIGFAGGAYAFGAQISLPAFVLAAFSTQLADDDEPLWIRVKGFGYQTVGD